MASLKRMGLSIHGAALALVDNSLVAGALQR
jgi:hypothetical protein